MADEAIAIHSIFFLDFGFGRKSRSNRSKLSDSRDNNDLSEIKLTTTWWERLKRFNDFFDCSLTIGFRLYLSTSIVDQNEMIFHLNNQFEKTRIVNKRWAKASVQFKYQIIHQHSVRILQQSIVANELIVKKGEFLFKILLEIQIFLSDFSKLISVFVDLFEHLEHHFENDEITRVDNSIDIDMLNCFAVSALNHVSCFDLFRIEMIFIRSELVHHVEISVFKRWIVAFSKNDRIRKFRWSLACNDEWRKRFSKFSTRFRQISFERRILILLSRKRFFQFVNLFFICHHFFLKWDDFFAQTISLIFRCQAAFLCLNDYLESLLLFLFQLFSTLHTFEDGIALLM